MKFYSVSYIERNMIVLYLDFVNFVKKIIMNLFMIS